jgi:hypothetical protein
MKTITLLICIFLSVSCSAINKYDDERMYDLASKFKDLSQSIDGHIKFSEDLIYDGDQILNQMLLSAPNLLTSFADFTIKVSVQKSNAILLLCDGDIALIEDAGCNAVMDKILWKDVKPNSCEFTIDSIQLCN